MNVEQRGAGGRVQVALLEEDRQTIPGYGPADARPITTDPVRCRVTWRGREDLRAILGRSVRIQVRLSGNAVVYALAIPARTGVR